MFCLTQLLWNEKRKITITKHTFTIKLWKEGAAIYKVIGLQRCKLKNGERNKRYFNIELWVGQFLTQDNEYKHFFTNISEPYHARWYQKAINTLTNLQVLVTGLFKYVWHSSTTRYEKDKQPPRCVLKNSCSCNFKI